MVIAIARVLVMIKVMVIVMVMAIITAIETVFSIGKSNSHSHSAISSDSIFSTSKKNIDNWNKNRNGKATTGMRTKMRTEELLAEGCQVP